MWLRVLLAALTLAAAHFPAARAAPMQAWVKLCEDGACRLHHERLDGRDGSLILSLTVRGLESSGRKVLSFKVPGGIASTRTLRAAVYDKGQWERKRLNKNIDDADLFIFDLQFLGCDMRGCFAETAATASMVKRMKAGGGVLIAAKSPTFQLVGFPVPLDGFAAAWDGPPVDAAAYQKARNELLQSIVRRKAPTAPANPDAPPPLLGSDGAMLLQR